MAPSEARSKRLSATCAWMSWRSKLISQVRLHPCLLLDFPHQIHKLLFIFDTIQPSILPTYFAARGKSKPHTNLPAKEGGQGRDVPVHGRSVRLQSSVLRFELQALQLAKFLLHFIASKTFDAENPPIGTYDLSVLHIRMITQKKMSLLILHHPREIYLEQYIQEQRINCTLALHYRETISN